uniref:Terminase-like family n=1 Tax=Candidatus Kentrum sp. UNK TaxID=2126344 RepID=A0A451ANX5_9GAMM|nr:MAG: Terminase-like family [Candidatus Kentron sp. UNK]VFK73050.1 MAG: Terminase-like family [Candidatus Kentron sp. UNK]
MPHEPRAQRTPAVMLGYQQRVLADTSPLIVIEKSRRIGLTWAKAGDSALKAAERAGQDIWYTGYNKDMAQEFIRDAADWAKHYALAAGEITEEEEVFSNGKEEKAIQTFVIRFASGFRITALSSRPANMRAKKGIFIIDEAAFHEQLGELLKAVMAALMWGGRLSSSPPIMGWIIPSTN